MRASLIGDAERADDELARPDSGDCAAHLFDDAAIFMTHRHRRRDVVQSSEGPQIGSANAGRRQPDDGVGRMEYLRLGDLLATHVMGSIRVAPSIAGSPFRLGQAIQNAARDRKAVSVFAGLGPGPSLLPLGVLLVRDLLHRVTAEPSFISAMAICVIAQSGVAPCQCFSPGSNQTMSPGRISSIGPPHLPAARGRDRL